MRPLNSSSKSRGKRIRVLEDDEDAANGQDKKDDGVYDDDDAHNTPKYSKLKSQIEYQSPKKRPKTVNANNGNWKKNQIMAVKKSLNTFGFGRWQKIANDSDLMKDKSKTDGSSSGSSDAKLKKVLASDEPKTVEEIQSICENFISHMFGISKSDEKQAEIKITPALHFQAPMSQFLDDTKRTVVANFFALLDGLEVEGEDQKKRKKELLRLADDHQHCSVLELEEPSKVSVVMRRSS